MNEKKHTTMMEKTEELELTIKIDVDKCLGPAVYIEKLITLFTWNMIRTNYIYNIQY